MSEENRYQADLRLSRDVELKRTQSDKSVANGTGVVTVRNYKDANDEWQREVLFIDFELWDTGAERFSEKYGKGDTVFAIGKLRQDRWETPEGQKRSKLVFRIEKFYDGPYRAKREEATETETVPANASEDNLPF